MRRGGAARYQPVCGWRGIRLIVISKHFFNVLFNGGSGFQKRFPPLNIFDAAQFPFSCAWNVPIFDGSVGDVQFISRRWFARISFLESITQWMIRRHMYRFGFLKMGHCNKATTERGAFQREVRMIASGYGESFMGSEKLRKQSFSLVETLALWSQ